MHLIRPDEKPAFDDVYRMYYDRVYKYAYTLLLHRENAEDVVSETFIAAYTHYGSFDPAKASVLTWLTRIAHNNAVNFLRSAAYRTRADLPEQDLRGFEDADLIALSEVNEEALTIYAGLKEEEREFLNMRYAMELRDAEVADLLNLNVKAVNKRYQRLLAKCRRILSEAG